MRLFVETVGHYTDYISTQQDGLPVFQVRQSFSQFTAVMD